MASTIDLAPQSFGLLWQLQNPSTLYRGLAPTPFTSLRAGESLSPTFFSTFSTCSSLVWGRLRLLLLLLLLQPLLLLSGSPSHLFSSKVHFLFIFTAVSLGFMPDERCPFPSSWQSGLLNFQGDKLWVCSFLTVVPGLFWRSAGHQRRPEPCAVLHSSSWGQMGLSLLHK